MHKQYGFGLLGVLLVIVVLGVVGFAGYTVWNNDQDEQSGQTETVQTTEQETQNNQQNEQPSEVDSIPEGWVEYASETDMFSVYYPSEWFYWDECQEGSTETYTGVALGSSEEYSPLCPSDKPTQVNIYKRSGSIGSCSDSGDSIYVDDSSCSDVVIAGLSGIKSSYTDTGEGLREKGTIQVTYKLSTGNNEYYNLSYTQTPQMTDDLTTFEEIVKTFKPN